MKKETIKQAVAPYMAELTKMADRIYDLAEPGLEEVRSSAILTDYLEKKGFQIERGIAGLPTAFRAVYEQGNGGPSFGSLSVRRTLPGIQRKVLLFPVHRQHGRRSEDPRSHVRSEILFFPDNL